MKNNAGKWEKAKMNEEAKEWTSFPEAMHGSSLYFFTFVLQDYSRLYIKSVSCTCWCHSFNIKFGIVPHRVLFLAPPCDRSPALITFGQKHGVLTRGENKVIRPHEIVNFAVMRRWQWIKHLWEQQINISDLKSSFVWYLQQLMVTQWVR